MNTLVPVYRRRASALHTARAGVGAAYCAALALVCVLYTSPVILAAVLVAVLAAGLAAGVAGELRKAALIGLPVAVLMTVINPLVYQEGETVLVRGWVILGHRFDMSLEALAFGAAAGLRFIVLVLAFGLFSAVVDPDRMLALMRRVSYRSALTAALATRLVPVLARDAGRMGDAARCRPSAPGRATVARAVVAGSLDRAVDLAAALETRGYASATRPRAQRTPWSRHDVAVAAAALAIALLAVAGALAGVGGFDPYPGIALATGPQELVLGSAIVACALAPFAGARARVGVAARA